MSYTKEKIMLAFSYMAYLGFALRGTDKNNEKKILEEINEALKKWKPYKDDDWEVVWGPAVYSIPNTQFDDAMMYAVHNKSEPSQYVIAIRGTNPISLPDWLFNDFRVKNMDDWPYGTPGELKPKISESTSFGLRTLQELKPKSDMPGENTTILEFLNNKLEGEGEINICLTGHSKGGALSSTMALWLKDIQGAGFPRNANISTVPFAGPTAGNADFAEYFDQRLGKQCDRIANSLDIAPYAWNTQSLRRCFTLYLWHLPPLYPNAAQRTLLRKKILDTKGNNYMQIKADTPPLEGRFNRIAFTYFTQATYQHVVGYPELMGMMDDIPLNEIFSFSKNILDLLE